MSAPAIDIRCAPPWLVADFGGPRRVLSWAPHRGGAVTARRIVWREVRNADLHAGLDAGAWLAGALAGAGYADAVGLLTSRPVALHDLAAAEAEGAGATCLATVGLSNAERVGARRASAAEPEPAWGTVNIALALSARLTEAAEFEALTIAAEARTAAIMDAGLPLPGGPATGTGTDCLALALPLEGPALPHAGLHTPLGEAIGRPVAKAVGAGAARWLAERSA